MADQTQSGWTRHLMLAVFIGACSSGVHHGFNIGVTNAPQLLITKFINETKTDRDGKVPDENAVNWIFSFMVACFCLGGIFGSLITNVVASRFGRKGGLVLNNGIVFIAAGLFAFCKNGRSYEMLIIGRFVVGVNAGLNAGLGPVYLTEMAPVSLRGQCGSAYQLAVTFAIVISQLLGLPQILGSENLWPYLFALIAVWAIVMIAALSFCPESPKHLLINMKKDAEAQKALQWLRGTDKVETEMGEMRVEALRQEQQPKVGWTEMVKSPVLRQPLIIVIVVMLSQQLSGINAAMAFSSDIFRSAGLSDSHALYATLGMGIVNVLMTCVSLSLVDKAGRRTLLLTGYVGMAVSCIALALCIRFSIDISALGIVSVVAVYVFVISFATGPGSIPWFLVGEMFDMSSKEKAAAVATAVNWIANFFIFLTFLPIRDLMAESVFLTFTTLLIVFWAYVYKRLPETKGHTVAEVTSIFRR